MPQPGVTLYAHIAETLRRRIEAGDLAPDSRLPSQRALAAEFATTLVTVRHALRLLQEEGLVRIEHGVGSFVAAPRLDYDLRHLSTFTAGRCRQGDIATLIVQRERTVAHPEAAQALNLAAPALPGRLTRVRRAGDLPIVYQHSYLPPDLSDLVFSLAASDSLYEAIEARTGRDILTAREILQPVRLTRAQAAILRCPPDALAFRSCRVSFDGDDRPVVYDEAFLPEARVRVVTDRVADRWSLEYQPAATEERGEGQR